MAYNRPKTNRTWIEKTLATSYEIAKQTANNIKYKLGTNIYKISVEEQLLKTLKTEQKEVLGQLNTVIKNSNYHNRDNPTFSKEERRRLKKLYQPEIDDINHQILVVEQRLKELTHKRKTQISTEKSLSQDVQVGNLTQKSIPQQQQKNETKIKTLEEQAQQFYNIKTFRKDVNNEVNNYLTLDKKNRENLIQSYLSNASNPDFDKGLKLYFIQVLRKIEDIEQRVIYTNYAKDDILLEIDNDKPLVANYMNSSIQERMELKNMLYDIKANEAKYPRKNIDEVDKLLKDIELEEARLNIKKLIELKQQAKREVERKRGR